MSFLSKLVSYIFDRYTGVTNDDKGIHVQDRHGSAIFFKYQDLLDFPAFRKSFFSVKIVIKAEDKTAAYSFTRFSPVYAFSPESILDFNQITEHFETKVDEKLEEFFRLAKDEYLRDSSVDLLEKNINPLIHNYQKNKNTWDKYISIDKRKNIESCSAFFPIMKNIEILREEYVTKQLNLRGKFYDNIESNPLTEEQRLAVIRENDRNLVLAAAGTGKTSVMVAKALDLIDSGQLKATDILVLAYNNAAAQELRDRVALRAKAAGLKLAEEPQISTFHSLGRSILRESKIPTHISVLAEDSRKFDKWVNDWLVEYISSSPTAMKNFIAIHFRPADPFEFKTKEEYERYIRDNEYRCLNGDLVRGYQELLIANWLFLNGIKFQYEAPYVSKVRVDIGYDYKPDFHITDTNIFIEHFGIDRQGNTRPDIDAVAYNKGIESKRELHAQYGTRLIETFHYDWCEGCLEASLEKQLSELGIKPEPISNDEIFKALNESGVIDSGAKMLQKSLHAIRTEQLGSPDIQNRLEKAKVPFADKYAEILNSIHISYVSHLRESNTIDFDDMIIRATECIESQRFQPHWKFILVDEFQDISGSRMKLLNNLISKGQNTKLTVVGDDWQSIYRFAGGKLELTTRFTELVGSNTLTKLQKTFRYNNSIADTAGTFIMENDEQYKKHIKTYTVVNESQIYLLDSKIKDLGSSMPAKAVQIIKKIRETDQSGSIAILSRYNYLLIDTKFEVKAASLLPNIQFWTFHGSKGLEADYCILVGFAQGKLGFPNENKDDEVVEALLPSLDQFPHSEERRLMYVALTRAKKKAYIIADPTAPSAFITELISPKYKLHIASSTFKEAYRKIFKCPSCTDGYFKQVEGQFGRFYVCSSQQACKIKPRVCKSCSAPSIDDEQHSKCTNPNCGETFKICPRCARPMVLRESKFGKFYGCSGYGIKEDQCKQTVKL